MSDPNSLRFVHDDEEQQLMQIHLLTDCSGPNHTQLLAWNEAQGNVAYMAANRRRMTKIGTFHAYALVYLQRHVDISSGIQRIGEWGREQR
ncbi:hypothetical protein ALQ33_04949 [Pseudomonas syringae pv. philadelphi]|uniref:Uncharacterized protein n=1 Tax=Pseudomonas syringae pv. philadelphi TaxID=251706 RepID=A0A3M3YIC8_9PSED|nr:hypothetical protein ALQ33_04949 [Pseudomonas syringae pv. philadelphi]